jgi:diphosphomevalonate decarboxylase
MHESKRNEIALNGREATPWEKKRIEVVLNKLKELAHFQGSFKVKSENSLKKGKGLGFSASGFAALGLATAKALNLEMEEASLSEIVRLGAGSATRSLAGYFAIWYSSKAGRSYAEQLDFPKRMDFCTVIAPIHSNLKTDEAHTEVVSSCLFQARLNNVSGLLRKMKKAISMGDTSTVGRLAEEDTLNLHAITMTGKSHMLLWEPDTIRIMKEVIQMREEEIPCWYSMDTGPSVFINTYKENKERITQRLKEMRLENTVTSMPGGKPFLSRNHLF